MPIRFRCAFCNQLMGISRRKAGQVVSCPKCSGQVVVPTPEGDSDDGEPDPGPGRALDAVDVEKLLAPPDAGPKPALKQPRPKPAAMEIDVEPFEFPAFAPPPPSPTFAPPKPAPGTMSLRKATAIGLGAAALLLIGLAFLLGYLVGKRSGFAAGAASVATDETK